MSTHDTLAGRLGSFVSGISLDTVPADVVEKAKACLLNAYGIGIGSNHLPYGVCARRAAFDTDGVIPDGATVFGDGRKTTIAGATMANGVLFHGRNQEDFTWGSTHTGVVIVPVLTALIEAKKLSTENLIPAIIAGYEVAGILDAAFASKTTPNFFRGTPLYGVVGAAAAVARLYGLPPEQTQAALANAAGFAGGTLQSQAGGSDEWRYQVGIFGNVGMMAANLARAGSNSAPLAFEGRAGYAKAFARADCDVNALTKDLNKEWAIRKVSFKPYPLPAWNQTPVDLGVRVREKIAGRPIRSVDVTMSAYEVNYPGKNSRGPFDNDTSAKLSIAFTVATTLAHGTPTFPVLLDYRNDRTTYVLERVNLVGDPEMPRLSCRMVVTLDSGEVITEELFRTAADYSYDCAKVSELARRVGKETDVPVKAFDMLDEFVRRLPGKADIQQVVDAFALMPKM